MSAKNRSYLKHLLDGVTALTASSSVEAFQTEKHSFETWFVGTGSEVVVMDVEGNLSNAGRWFNMGTLTYTAGQITAGEALLDISDTLVNRIRVVPVTLTNVTAFSVDYTQGRRNTE